MEEKAAEKNLYDGLHMSGPQGEVGTKPTTCVPGQAQMKKLPSGLFLLQHQCRFYFTYTDTVFS